VIPLRGLLALLILAFPITLLLWRSTLDTLFFAISADDLHRVLYSWEVTQGVLIPSDIWPPLQFWIQALFLKIYPDLLTVPMLVNLAASTGTLLCLLLLGKTLGLNRVGLIIMSVLAATLPWFIWLSLSGLAEPLLLFFLTLAYLSIARWYIDNRAWGVWCAAVALLAASMVRYDALGHSAIFSLALGWRWLCSPITRPHQWLIAAAIPWLFPLPWFAYQYNKYGHPFHFSEITRQDYLSSAHPQNLSLITRLLAQPQDLWLVAGITIPLGVVGLWLMRKHPGVQMMSLMWIGSFALLIQSTVNYTITKNNPPRLVVIHALLLLPGAALILQYLTRRAWGAILTLVLCAALILPRIANLPHYPNIFDPAVAYDSMLVGRHINALRDQGDIQFGDHILIEVIFWDYILLHALSNDPDAVLYDREPIQARDAQRRTIVREENNPSLLAQSPAELQATLAQQQVRVVIVHSSRAVAQLTAIADETFHAGRFYVFLVPPDHERP
jgi:hypothetical protein